ncbi:Uncharacterised protein [Mycobacteroides abscessus subsp. abscessus]|nr:Uncharacterised protein [Mycobacteroides abscessus subsp. abscessus]
MSKDETRHDQNPFTRPGFILAAVLVVAVLVLGVAVGAGILLRPKEPAPTASSSAAPTASEKASSDAVNIKESAGKSDSVCGLKGSATEGKAEKAPAAEWEYQGTIAYPVSKAYGPGDTTDEGVRMCYQHTPEGAVVMAANAVAQGSDPEALRAFTNYVTAEGPGREKALAQRGNSKDSSGTRLRIVGYRVLHYDGENATIDLALEVSTQGKVLNMSAVYPLVWQKGDWKLDPKDGEESLDVATISSTSGYIPWGASDG